jgi:hypothetical protein
LYPRRAMICHSPDLFGLGTVGTRVIDFDGFACGLAHHGDHSSTVSAARARHVRIVARRKSHLLIQKKQVAQRKDQRWWNAVLHLATAFHHRYDNPNGLILPYEVDLTL